MLVESLFHARWGLKHHCSGKCLYWNVWQPSATNQFKTLKLQNCILQCLSSTSPLFECVNERERISHIRSCYYVGLCCEINRIDIWKGCIQNFLVFSSWWLSDVEPNLIKLQLSIDNTHIRIESMNASHHHVGVGVRAWLQKWL
jgi:hypothetical protein